MLNVLRRQACPILTAAALISAWLPPTASVAHPKDSGEITTFDVPGAAGTYPIAINKSGTIAGGYATSGSPMHGFLLDAQGDFTTFDAPDATAGTFVSGMDESGTVIGTYVDAGNVTHGFSRAADGSFTRLTGRGGVLLSPRAIARKGGMAGVYAGMNGLGHGFALSPKGRFSAFEIPGSGVLSGQGTYADAINDAGQIGGIYIDVVGARHPFVRSRNGAAVTLSPPGSFVSGLGYQYAPLFVRSIGIDAAGLVMGNYFQPIQGNPFGGAVNVFIQGAEGAPVVFGIGDSGCCTFTYGTGINASGAVIGYDDDIEDINHGFVRTTDGTITIFDAPGAGTKYFQGTLPASINAAGVITGTFQDENYVWHGFIRQP